MKLKKKNVLILLTLMFILMTSMFSMVSARTENKWFGLELLRESGNGYIVNGKTYGKYVHMEQEQPLQQLLTIVKQYTV